MRARIALLFAVLSTASLALLCSAAADAPATSSPVPQLSSPFELPPGAKHPDAPPPGATLPQPEANPKLAKNAAGQVVQLRALDDPANPYRGQYTDYDRWYVEHYAPEVPDAEKNLFYNRTPGTRLPANYPEHWVILRDDVTSDGWLMPWKTRQMQAPGFLLKKQTIREQVLGFPSYDPADEDKKFIFWAVGVQPPELLDELRHESNLHMAPEYPRIPAWLGERLPLRTVFAPNGDVLCYGPLGLHYLEQKGSSYPNLGGYNEGEKWYRYTADGKLLGTYDTQAPPYAWDGDWQQVYTDFAALEKQLRAEYPHYGVHFLAEGGRAYVEYSGTGDAVMGGSPQEGSPKVVRIYAAYDYAGHPLDLDSIAPTDFQHGRALPREFLEPIYKAQVELGLTDPNAKSPWEGTPQGPVAVDPTPRPPRVFASRQKPVPPSVTSFFPGDYSIRVEVRPLDDPGNPYRGQYGDWDYWLVDNVGKSNPAQAGRFEAERARQQAVKALQARKQPVPPGLSKPIMLGSFAESDDPWKHYEIRVDENGYMLPAAMSFQRDQEEAFAYDYRNYEIPRTDTTFRLQPSGVMPADMHRRLDLARWSTVASRYPRIPDWLVAKPTYKAAVMPNGDVVTEGEVGSWNADASVVYDQRFFARDKDYYRYSPTGKLLQHTSREEWAALFNPGFQVSFRPNETYGYGQHPEAASFFVIFAGVRGSAVAAYDYDGTQLKVDRPLVRGDGSGRFLTWEELTGLYAAQHALITNTGGSSCSE